MPPENYKKITMAAIAVLIIGIVVIAVMTSDNKKEQPSSPGSQRGMVPPGPMTGTPMQPPAEQLGELPDDPKELALLGDRYFETGRFADAVQIYQKVLEKDPNDIDTYNDMGLALHYIKQSDAAIDILKKGAQIMPSYQRLWMSLGFIQMAVGKNDEARKSLEKAVELNPRNDVGEEARKLLDSLKTK